MCLRRQGSVALQSTVQTTTTCFFSRWVCVSSCGLWEGPQLGPSLVCVQEGYIWSTWLVWATSCRSSAKINSPDYQKNVSLMCSLPKQKTNSDCKWTTKIYAITEKQPLNTGTLGLIWLCFMPLLFSSADLGRLKIFPKRERVFFQK